MLTISLTGTIGELVLDIDAKIPTNGISGLVGPSGSGKSTLLRAIAGLDKLWSGRIEFNNDLWFDSKTQYFCPPHLRSIGYVFQESGLFPHLTVQKNLEFAKKRAPQACPQNWIELFDLTHLLKRYPSTLSGGEKQRVAMARCLYSNPKLLLLDEPLSGLDQKKKNEIIPCLQKLKSESQIPIIYVSHSMDEINQLCDHIYMLDNGILRTN